MTMNIQTPAKVTVLLGSFLNKAQTYGNYEMAYYGSLTKKQTYPHLPLLFDPWSRRSSLKYLRIQSVPQREHQTSPLEPSTG
jgi:hypothetical protein